MMVKSVLIICYFSAIFLNTVFGQSCPSAGDSFCQSLDTPFCRWTGCYDCVDGFCHCYCVHPCCGQGTLPGWCFSPPGDDCSWYENCLAERFPDCTGTPDDYAIAFGKRYCELYQDRYDSDKSLLSPMGKQWLDATRQCLQQALVGLLDLSTSTSCKKIKNTAFKSHPDCYVNPQPGAPGICDLPVSDWFNIFRVTSSALATEPMYYIAQAWSVAVSCGKDMLIGGSKKVLIKLKDELNPFQRESNIGLGYTHNETVQEFYVSQEAINAMAREINWDRSSMDWVAVPMNDSSIHMMLVDPFELGFIPEPPVIVQLDKKVREFNEATANGVFNDLQLDDGKTFSVAESAGCNDNNCTDTYDEQQANSMAPGVSPGLLSLLIAGNVLHFI